ncbi:MAG: FHA domain-containing protein, partial [Myxococcota bacterium]
DTDPLATIVDRVGRVLDEDDQALVRAHLARRGSERQPIRRQRSDAAFARGSDILLDDDLTSRTHAMVFLDADGLSLVDLGSTNGTFVNKRPVTDADLEDGDVVHIGRSRFVVRVQPPRT